MSDEAAITVTLKAGEGYDAPWVVVRADNPIEAATRLAGVVDLLAAVAGAAADLQGFYAAASGLGARAIQAPPPAPSFAAPAPVQAPYDAAVAYAAPAPVAPQQAGLETRTDRYNNKYTFGVPGAPACPHGTRVLKQGTKKDGSGYTAYICPQIDGAFRVQTECKAIYQ